MKVWQSLKVKRTVHKHKMLPDWLAEPHGQWKLLIILTVVFAQLRAVKFAVSNLQDGVRWFHSNAFVFSLLKSVIGRGCNVYTDICHTVTNCFLVLCPCRSWPGVWTHSGARVCHSRISRGVFRVLTQGRFVCPAQSNKFRDNRSRWGSAASTCEIAKVHFIFDLNMDILNFIRQMGCDGMISNEKLLNWLSSPTVRPL